MKTVTYHDKIDWATWKLRQDDREYERKHNLPEGEYCCLITGVQLRHQGRQVIYKQPATEFSRQDYYLYIPLSVWNMYVRFCETRGIKCGFGPFQHAMGTLPLHYGGEGLRLSDLLEQEYPKDTESS